MELILGYPMDFVWLGEGFSKSLPFYLIYITFLQLRSGLIWFDLNWFGLSWFGLRWFDLSWSLV